MVVFFLTNNLIKEFELFARLVFDSNTDWLLVEGKVHCMCAYKTQNNNKEMRDITLQHFNDFTI